MYMYMYYTYCTYEFYGLANVKRVGREWVIVVEGRKQERECGENQSYLTHGIYTVHVHVHMWKKRGRG